MCAASVIKAVHDVDLERVLRRLGLYEDLVSGRLRCAVCGCSLSFENLGGLYRGRDGRVKLVCNRIECLVKAAEEVEETRRNKV